MSLEILVDMNLSPDWVPLLEQAGFAARHWSRIGAPTATDESIMRWAAAHGYLVFTHDLDFGTVLALTHTSRPSVFQIRTIGITPARIGPLVVAALRQHEQELTAGAIVVVDEQRRRVRILPL